VHPGLPAVDATEHRGGIDILLAGWKADYPDVDVSVVSEADQPDALITELSADASELVVGAPRHRPRAPLWYWSVTRRVLEASSCPLVVVPEVWSLDPHHRLDRSTGHR
jgi:nucleotide-binding universal stress UspA family protein